MASSSQENILGIDLGTTTSAAAWLNRKQLEMILSESGARTIPSFAAFTAEKRLVGEEAYAQAGENAANTIYEIKRLIGRTMQDSTIKEDLKIWPFKVLPDGDGKPRVHVTYQEKEEAFYPEQISAMILSQLKKIAGEFFRSPVKKVVITVPAAYTDAQRQATIDAGRFAELDVLRIINEPTAAAIAYGYTNELQEGENRRVLVFDLGGGTFDVSILTMEKNEYKVIGTLGDVHLGGGDFDARLQTHVEDKFEGGNLEGNFRARWRLRVACEKAKKELSTDQRAFIEIENLLEGHNLRVKITRAAFEELCRDLFEKTIDITKKCLQQASLTAEEIDDVVLVGGSTRIPRVRELVSEMFGEEKIRQSINPDEAVAQGAALQAAMLAETNDEESFDLVVRDQLPRSLGVSGAFGCSDLILKKGEIIPTMCKKTYNTSSKKQTKVRIPIVEGESEYTDENKVLDNFILNLKPGTEEKQEVEVTFSVNADGVLEVKASSVNSGQSSGLIVQRSRRQFTDDEFKRFRETDEHMEGQNRKQTEQEKARNKLSSLAYRLHKVVALKEKCDNVLKWLDDNPRAEKQLLDDHIEELTAIDSARQHALEELEEKATQLHAQPELTEVCAGILSWIKESRSTASKEDFQKKLVELTTSMEPSVARACLENSIRTTRRTCKTFPEVQQKCKDLSTWLSTCGRDTKEREFIKRLKDLNDLVQKCLAANPDSASDNE